jgi:hypothetical protein
VSGSAKTETSGTTSSQTSPWAPQADALKDAFGNAATAYDQASTATAPTDFTAQMTPDQLATFNSMIGYGGSTDTTAQSAAGATNTAAGTNAATGALSGLSSYDPTIQNNTQSLIDSANKYADGQNIPAAVAAAMQQGNETARDITLPGIDQNAAITGNTNNSRAGLAGGIVQRGLAETAANMSGTMHNAAYNNGLNLAETAANANNAAKLGALTAQGTIGNTTTNTGVNATGQAIADQTGLYNIANTGGAGQQAATQADLDNQSQQFTAATSAPYTALDNYMKIIGQTNFGSSTTGTSNSTSTQTPSAWQIAGGLMGGAGSLIGSGGLGNMFSPTQPTWVTGSGNGAGGYAYPMY